MHVVDVLEDQLGIAEREPLEEIQVHDGSCTSGEE